LLGLIRNKLGIQIISRSCLGRPQSADIPVRLVLSSVFSLSFAQLAKALRYRYGSAVRIWFILLSLTQFHVPYYAGRTLPNFMALPGGIPLPAEAQHIADSLSLSGIDLDTARRSLVDSTTYSEEEGPEGSHASYFLGDEYEAGTGGVPPALNGGAGIQRYDDSRRCYSSWRYRRIRGARYVWPSSPLVTIEMIWPVRRYARDIS
jgi:hypothetical protein